MLKDKFLFIFKFQILVLLTSNVMLLRVLCMKEQVQWAVDGGCDYIIAETFCYLGEALIALDVIKEAGKSLM